MLEIRALGRLSCPDILQVLVLIQSELATYFRYPMFDNHHYSETH
ncbi:MAG: hypothetical protein AAF546_09095 [Verrucomicrobiota bacterium]